jgi:hypothetical protein
MAIVIAFAKVIAAMQGLAMVAQGNFTLYVRTELSSKSANRSYGEL